MSIPAPRGNRDLDIFWCAQILSAAGYAFTLVAIPLLVLHTTGSVIHMGLVTVAAGVASLVTGVFAGVVVDRFDRRRLLVGCDIARAVLYGTIPLTWLFATPIWLVYVIVPAGAACAMLFQVGYVAVVPRLVDADRITAANGRLSAGYAVAGLAGPVLAGVLSGRFGPVTAIAVDAATFAVSAASVWLVRLRPASGGPTRPVPLGENLLTGARFLWRHPVLRAMTALLTLLIFFSLVLAAAVFCFTAIGGLRSMSLRQQVTPDALLGRVTAAYWTIHSVLGPVGAAVLTTASARFGVPAVLVVSGLVYAAVAAAGLLTPVRQPAPESLPAG